MHAMPTLLRPLRDRKLAFGKLAVASALMALSACGEDTTISPLGGADASASSDGNTAGVGGDGAAAGTDAATGDGGATDPDTTQAGADGGTDAATVDPDGASGGTDTGTVDPDGGSGATDGGSGATDGTATDPDGGTVTPDAGSGSTDGVVTDPDGGTVTPDGGTGTPDGGTVTPDGGTGTPDGGSSGTDGGVTDPDGGTVTPDTTTGDGGGTTGDGGTPTDAGTPPACKIDADCGKAGICAAVQCSNGSCVTGKAADGSACDDGDGCTANDTCKAGACSPGTAKDCNDNAACTDDTCDPKTGFCANSANTAACDDGNACTSGDSCKGGKCEPGAPNACDDKNPCTADTCDPAKGGCANAPQDGKCDDGSLCTSDDACKAGKCGGKATSCDDGNACTTDTCDGANGNCVFKVTPNAACDDGSACTDKDACANNGKCAGTTKVCDDGNPCTTDNCDAKTGCGAAPNTAACDDGNLCTDGDACKDGKCQGGAAKACNDNNACTDDTCDPKVANGCVFTPNTAPCNAGDLCQAAVCKAGKCEPAAGPKDCGDKNDCTADSCDPKVGCVNKAVADGSACGSANDLCQQPAKCKAGACEGGAKLSCDDGNACTNDSCDPKTGCAFAPNSNPCDDGNACTIGDKCGVVAGKGATCTPGSAIDLATCDDKNPCTTDSCDPKTGCAHANNTAACDDGSKCTNGDVCGGGKCAGKPSGACDDGNPCTNDNCDAKTGDCTWTGTTGACDDGNACTTGEACSASNCTGGTAKVCDDKSPCTADSCDAKTGNCVNAAGNDGAQCDDGSACTSADACAAGKCTGKAKVCDDANACTDDTCDPKTGTCATANNTAACDDGDKCTGPDACNGGACKAGAAVVCDDKSPCTTDTCDKVKGCVYTAAADGTVCDDGIACTKESICKAGACMPNSNCKFLDDPFDCGEKTKWVITTPNSPYPQVPRKVVWKVDEAPKVGTPEQQAAHKCTLNFNDDTDYCDGYQFGGNTLCLPPAGTARSPDIDWVGLNSGVGELVFDAYYDVDPSADGQPDLPQILVRNSNGNGILLTINFPKATTDLKVWKQGVKQNLTGLLKHKFYLETTMQVNSQWATGNLGAGIFIDNVKVNLNFVGVPENCTDGIDNNGDGNVDCADATCANVYPCNAKKLLDETFLCSGTDWTYASTHSSTGFNWAIDNTPAVTPPTGTCSLNYNNGTGYDAKSSSSQSQSNAGTATYNKLLDATGLTKVNLALKYYYDTENNNQSANFDIMHVQLSTDNFNGCCNVSTQCNDQTPANCNKNGTRSYVLPRFAVKTWLTFTQDLAQHFAGKKDIKVRIRFNTVDEKFNNFPGPRVDDLLIVGGN
ncbi:MAG: hypothetical protein FJ100_06095 [Deltaproteobacteria bacterium]|nr:hypothetical protein [Deltaproteobacteria bacterium]